MHEEKFEDFPTPTYRRHRRWGVICAAAIVLLITTIVVGGILEFFLPEQYQPTKAIHDWKTSGGSEPNSAERQRCPSTPQEAKESGCHYDHLAHLWLPPSCTHPNRNHDYLTANNGTRFAYYLDGDGDQQVDIADQLYHTPIFTTTKEHLAHCAYTLMRTAEWMRDGGWWERKVLSPDHLDHCVMMLYNASMFHPQLNDLESFTFLDVGGECFDEVRGKKKEKDQVAVFPDRRA